MSTKPPPMICGICRRTLDVRTTSMSSFYQHTVMDFPADHLPQPIPMPEDYREGRCDFCSIDWPGFVLPVRDFQVPGHPNYASDGDWAACATCAALIKANKWEELATRSIKTSPHAMSYAQIELLRDLHLTLRDNITGPIRPVSKGRA